MKHLAWLALPAVGLFFLWRWLRSRSGGNSRAEAAKEKTRGAVHVDPPPYGLPGYANSLPGYRPQDGYRDGALIQEAGSGFNGDSGVDVSNWVRPGQELGAGFNGGGGGTSGGSGATGVV